MKKDKDMKKCQDQIIDQAQADDEIGAEELEQVNGGMSSGREYTWKVEESEPAPTVKR